ncbi:MAG TPA: alpha/beta fold hydrolase [Elusimicrobiales bacterium]|nr:alpha/beta fold hydrolase [Elusimicrobiales bacterium]
MSNFLLWLIITLVPTLIIIVVVSYMQSKHILRPSGHRNPINFFPDMYNLVYERVTFYTQDDVMIKGWFIPAEQETSKTIVLLHGWGGNKANVLSNTHFLHKLGFNLFYFDFRGCGESSGSVSTIGYLETRDFKAALKFLKTYKNEKSKEIGVYSISMGASVGVYESVTNKDIKCIVAEAAFESYESAIARWAWVKRKIPYYPCVPLTLLFVRLKLKADPEAYSPIYHIDKLSPKPIFFIHGSHDDLVPPIDAKKLFKKAKEPKTWWLVPGANHDKCAQVGGEDYRQKMSDFFKTNL